MTAPRILEQVPKSDVADTETLTPEEWKRVKKLSTVALIVIGKKRLTVEELLNLKPGSEVEIYDKSPMLLVDDCTIARGEIEVRGPGLFVLKINVVYDQQPDPAVV